jgi:hypothetical protein
VIKLNIAGNGESSFKDRMKMLYCRRAATIAVAAVLQIDSLIYTVQRAYDHIAATGLLPGHVELR